ncbi:MAG: cytochrome C [Geobacteraceae bacterium GWB2_52_12]|nr:MAG: cytochrome C [Geobacteraceae bacterium GWB2_52_12]
MKKIVIMFALVAFAAGSAFAADVIEMKKGIKFDHKLHKAAVSDCKKCHEKGAGKIEGFGKDWSHKNCKGCHVDMKKGPTSCKECHK